MTVKIDGTNTVANPAFTGADTDTGLQCGTNELKLVTGGTTRATVDSSGRLLSGVTSAPGTVGGFSHVNIKGTSINANGAIGLYRNGTPTTGQGIGAIYFADSNGNPGAYIQGQSDGTWGTNDYPGRLVFYTTADGASSPTERMRILSGGGLTFGGDTAQANALDDYEEGTWTPAISNTGYTFTYSKQEGIYTKVGRLVTLRWYITVTARSGSSSGGIPIINVPLTTDGLNDSGSYFYPLPTQIIVHKAGNTSSSGTKTLLMAGFANSNTSNFWINNPNITGTTAFDMGSAFHIGGVVTYTSNA